MSADIRGFVKKTFSSRGVFLSSQSLNFLVEHFSPLDKDLQQKTIEKLLVAIEKENVLFDGFLNIDQLKDLIKAISRTKRHECEVHFQLDNYLEWRNLLSDRVQIAKNKYSVLANECMRLRFDLIKKAFSPEVLEYFVSTEALFSQRNCNVKVLGMFSRESGRAHLTIEDPSGDVRLNLKTAVYEPGLYFEGGVYGFEGSYDGYEFIVERAFLPKLNDPEKVQQKSTIPNNDLIVFLSGVPFDNDKVLNGLSQLFEGFKFDPPSIFVLFGPFTSVQKAYDYTNDQLAAFQQFVRLLKKVAAKNPAFGSTQFILIPSFEDPPSLIVMPRPPFPPTIQNLFKEFKNVHFGSNPCRLIYKDRTFLLCRDDLVEKLCRASMHMPEDASADSIPKLFCDTIWSQRHLSPLPLHFNPIDPNFDCLFHLYHTPVDLLVIGDRYKAFVGETGPIQTINPGSFLYSNLEFVVYYPGLRRAEMSAVPTNQ